MKNKVTAILLVLISVLFVGCTKDFEYSSDKFYLESIVDGSLNTTWYYFRKKIDEDIILESKSKNDKDGYELNGDTNLLGRWDMFIADKADESYEYVPPSDRKPEPYISAGFCCFSKEGMGDAKLNIYFNYTVKSTGERKEEVWEVDFGQKPFKDERKKK